MTLYRDQIKRDWEQSPYYELAEDYMAVFWDEGTIFRKCFEKLDLTATVELACGRGRHADFVRRRFEPGRITLVDINATNIEHCRQRFAGDVRFDFVVNSGSDLGAVPSRSCTALYSYDAMVHFEYDDVISYVRDAFRAMAPGGRVLMHHSNNDRQPGNLYSQNLHWRNFMSAALFAHAAMRAGFEVLEQHKFDWAGASEIDCLTLLEKPRKRE